MDSIIANSIKSFLFTRNIIQIEQHGFTKNKSVTTNLLWSANNWTKQLNNNNAEENSSCVLNFVFMVL